MPLLPSPSDNYHIWTHNCLVCRPARMFPPRPPLGAMLTLCALCVPPSLQTAHMGDNDPPPGDALKAIPYPLHPPGFAEALKTCYCQFQYYGRPIFTTFNTLFPRFSRAKLQFYM